MRKVIRIQHIRAAIVLQSGQLRFTSLAGWGEWTRQPLRGLNAQSAQTWVRWTSRGRAAEPGEKERLHRSRDVPTVALQKESNENTVHRASNHKGKAQKRPAVTI
ncbi:hypothetical protein NDU88_004482 [Pleurodeles waltl]|uniref:Uncharacterized protein n=1 Tax=Pleurodeles waltl TaxID=8319 RepID=A0AAV7W544_PLEWA|nr:hypothetical protein NDU88_004482 [Pleurodeles waltl]